jgi:hypothetical protein
VRYHPSAGRRHKTMNVSLFFCESAETAANGKLDLRGIYNELYAPGFPARQEHLILAGVVEWNREDHGTQPFKIDLMDPDGSEIFTIDGHSEVEARPQTRPPSKTHLILPLENLIFQQAGTYPAKVQIGGETIEGPSLYLMS